MALVLCAACFGLRPGESAAGDATVTDADGGTQSGTVTALSAESLTIDKQTYRVRDLLKLEWSGRKAAPVAGTSVVLLANGDLLAAAAQASEDEHLVASWTRFPDRPPLRLPLETVRGFVLSLPADLSEQPAVFRTVLDTGQKSDRFVLQNGDRLFGELTSLSPTGISIKSAVGTTELDRATVTAVGFNAEWISFPKVEGPQMLISLTDGSHLAAGGVELASGVLRMKAAYGANLEVPIEAVSAIRFLGGRAVYLSDLAPAEFHFTPYLGGQWPLQNDRNAAGGLLRLGGAEFPKGLGVHSKSEITYELGGAYRQFVSLAGIDDTAGPQGSAAFGVEVDGKRMFDQTVGSGEAPVVVGPIDVRGKQRLKLIVDFGQFGDIQDRADWCDAVLVK